MGKQKSFIIVGSTFVGVILLIILVSLITKGIKETKCSFESQTYAMEVGKSKALAPTLYAGGAVEHVELEYVAETEGVIEILEGTYSSGASSVYCWVFAEPNANGEIIEKESYIPHHEEDKISIKDGYWYINDTKTTCKAEKDYAGEDLNAYATRSISPKSITCFILNGIQTDILYDKTIVPERNEATGTWFINGKDTGYSYKGLHVTIVAKTVGTTVITAKGVVNGDPVSASTTIQVCLPNPKTIATEYLDNTVVINLNQEIKLDKFEVKAKAESVSKPAQDVTYTLVGSPAGATLNENVFKATEAGEYKVRIAAAKSAFTEGIGQYESVNTTVKVIVLDTTIEQILLISQARSAIEKINAAQDIDEIKSLVTSARILVNSVLESNQSAITNLKTLENAEKRLTE